MTSRVEPIRPPDADVCRTDELSIPRPTESDRDVLARFEVPSRLPPEVVVNALRYQKVVSDRAFDAIYPEPVRERSLQYWTRVDVARRAAELLVTDASTRVLDVGSGAGKFCFVGALTTPGHFTGVEQRCHLVEVARTIARHYGASRATYVHGDMRQVDWREFDAFYFFNPFAENCFRGDERFDDSVVLTPERREIDLRDAIAALARAPLGTRVATYHGLGCDLPKSYERVVQEMAGAGLLELWIQAT